MRVCSYQDGALFMDSFFLLLYREFHARDFILEWVFSFERETWTTTTSSIDGFARKYPSISFCMSNMAFI